MADYAEDMQMIHSLVRDVPDFPKPGIMFKDITPVLASREGFTAMVDCLANAIEAWQVDIIVAIEARGFIIGAPVAMALDCGFVPVRKPKKLPRPVFQVEYALEYGTDKLEMHQDAITANQNVVIIDDVLATGGTANACAQLVRQAGGNLLGFAFVIELAFLQGRRNLPNLSIASLLTYS
jgi:adenine phosphoribosyltransferase